MVDVLISGLPGKMASLVCEKIRESEDLFTLPIGLTGEGFGDRCHIIKSDSIKLIEPKHHEAYLTYLKYHHPRPVETFIAVDFTQPDAVNRNAELYCEYRVPFVMGTTDGDRGALEETVRNSEISAVIAPNMAKQIVAFQAMMQYAAENFPGVFSGYTLRIKESHQKEKKAPVELQKLWLNISIN